EGESEWTHTALDGFHGGLVNLDEREDYDAFLRKLAQDSEDRSLAPTNCFCEKRTDVFPFYIDLDLEKVETCKVQGADSVESKTAQWLKDGRARFNEVMNDDQMMSYIDCIRKAVAVDVRH